MKAAISGIMANLKGEVIAFGRGAERVFGYTKEEVLGKNVAIFHPERTRDILPRLFRTAMEKGVFEEEVVLVRKGGEEFPARLRVSAVRDREGNITGLAGITTDLSGSR